VLEAGCGFVNCIPVFIAARTTGQALKRPSCRSSATTSIPGRATIVHRTLARLFRGPGVKMLRTSQLNVGGNMDF